LHYTTRYVCTRERDLCQIVTFLAPYAQNVAEYPGSWLVPMILLTIVSFPPLFGHELIAMYILNDMSNGSLTGFVWSMPVAFLLVVTGSITGESLLFLSFRHFFHSRIVQFRKAHEDNYGTIVMVISEHKRWMVFLIRLSAIPVSPQRLVTDNRDISPPHCFHRSMRLSIASGYTWSLPRHGRLVPVFHRWQ
jgi:uncharacterized membrane protein YdjX (TVP38/TMEM64 family)